MKRRGIHLKAWRCPVCNRWGDPAFHAEWHENLNMGKPENGE